LNSGRNRQQYGEMLVSTTTTNRSSAHRGLNDARGADIAGDAIEAVELNLYERPALRQPVDISGFVHDSGGLSH
jgi:hypothetical protein